MNFLGHAYLASEVLQRTNELTVAGSLLPDIVPFVPNSTFSFEEIHEGEKNFLHFLEKNFPSKRDLALAMMIHGVKFGADKFNSEIEGWLLGDNNFLREEIVSGITECSGVKSQEVLNSRLHNYLWVGVDVYLLEKRKAFIKKLNSFCPRVCKKEIVKLLSRWSGKNEKQVLVEVNEILDPFLETSPENLLDYVTVWKTLFGRLPEADDVDSRKMLLLSKKINSLFEDKWEWILGRVVNEVRQTTKAFL